MSTTNKNEAVEALLSSALDKDAYVDLLRKLIAETPSLMNRPPHNIPQESIAAKIVLERLSPFLKENGGCLKTEIVENVSGRSNLIIEYPGNGTSDKTCAFVGSHFDVVHADPAKWDFDPFTLGVDGDKLTGRGVTDCLGHVALLTEIFVVLATQKPDLNISVFGVMIADEENGENEEIGVVGVMKKGKLDHLKNGPVYWLDCADKQPNIGSGGSVQWTLKASGKLAHSGFPHKAVNAIELGMDAMRYIQDRFYQDFPKHPMEDTYGFPCSSSLKPTYAKAPEGSLNQVRDDFELEGDIRLVPFYKIKDVIKAVDGYVQELNHNQFSQLVTRGPSSYSLKTPEGEHGSISWKWHSKGIDGIACDIESDGYKLLAEATEKYVGHCAPLADTGSLPLVADLKAVGWDVQTVGYGVEDAYHADNEFARLSDFCEGYQVLLYIISNLHIKA